MNDPKKDPLRIIALEVNNFRSLRFFAVQFPEEGGTFVVGGENGVGKTSAAIDSLRALMLGDKYKPTNPTRDGSALAAHVQALFGDGMVVERGGKNFSLKVTAPGDPNARQGLLDKRFARLAIDPSPLLKGNGAARVEALLQSLPGVGEKLAALDRQHDDLFSQRTAAGTLAKNAETQLAGMDHYTDAPDEETDIPALAAKISAIEEASASAFRAKEALAAANHFRDAPTEEISVAALAEDLREAEEVNRGVREAVAHANDLTSRIGEAESALAEMRRDLKATTETLVANQAIDADAIQAKLDTAEEDNAHVAANKEHERCRVLAVEARQKHKALCAESGELPDLTTAEEDNAKVRANATRKEKEADAKAKRAEHKRLDVGITSTRTARQALLEGADMPLEGLGIDPSGELTYKGQSWDGVAGSDQLEIAIRICHKQQPGCRFVVVGGCEEMDIKTLRRFSDDCKAAGLLAICTRVSVGPECDEIIAAEAAESE